MAFQSEKCSTHTFGHEPSYFGNASGSNVAAKRTKLLKIDLILLGDPATGKLRLANMLAERQQELKAEILRQYNLAKKKPFSKEVSAELTFKIVPSSSSDENSLRISQYLEKPSKSTSEKAHTIEMLLFCIAVNKPDSIKRFNSFWLSQLCEPDLVKLPLIFVGTNAELRMSQLYQDPELSSQTNNRLVAMEKAQALARWIGAIGYREFSALTEQGLPEVFEAIGQAATSRSHERKKQSLRRVSSFLENTSYAHHVLKFVLVGDGECGKNCLAKVFTTGTFPDQPYQPTPFEQYEALVQLVAVNSAKRCLDVPVQLWVTSGTNPKEGTIDYHNRLRGLAYLDSDAVLLCFSVEQVSTAPKRIESYWKQEIAALCPNVPVVLVGLKTDLRTDPLTLAKMGSLKPLSKEQGEELAKLIGAVAYAECSAKLSRGDVEAVFETAVKAVLETERYSQKHCSLM